MLADVTPYLACPHCGQALAMADGSLRCDQGHVFDVARQGYVNLLPGGAQTGSADTLQMVRARDEVFAAGHFEVLAEALATTAAVVTGPDTPGCVVDVGAGTGHYLAAVLQRLPHAAGVALDLSKHAARRAARAHPRIGAVVCDVWQPLPLRDGVAGLALSVFAPRNPAELWRVLRADAPLLLVTPTPQHLSELVTSLQLLSVDVDKPRRVQEQLAAYFTLDHDETLHTRLRLTIADVERIVLMGPNAWHTSPADLARRLADLADPLDVTLAVTLAVYRRRG